MYICMQVKGTPWVILEVTPERLDTILARCSKAESKASQDATLMALTNGSEITSNWGAPTLWYRVHTPMCYTPKPTECQITNARLGAVMYDGKTRHGPWAIMGETAWELYGCGRLGAGFGQKYLRNEAGEFYISEGMSSHPRSYRTSAA